MNLKTEEWQGADRHDRTDGDKCLQKVEDRPTAQVTALDLTDEGTVRQLLADFGRRGDSSSHPAEQLPRLRPGPDHVHARSGGGCEGNHG